MRDTTQELTILLCNIEASAVPKTCAGIRALYPNAIIICHAWDHESDGMLCIDVETIPQPTWSNISHQFLGALQDIRIASSISAQELSQHADSVCVEHQPEDIIKFLEQLVPFAGYAKLPQVNLFRDFVFFLYSMWRVRSLFLMRGADDGRSSSNVILICGQKTPVDAHAESLLLGSDDTSPVLSVGRQLSWPLGLPEHLWVAGRPFLIECLCGIFEKLPDVWVSIRKVLKASPHPVVEYIFVEELRRSFGISVRRLDQATIPRTDDCISGKRTELLLHVLALGVRHHQITQVIVWALALAETSDKPQAISLPVVQAAAPYLGRAGVECCISLIRGSEATSIYRAGVLRWAVEGPGDLAASLLLLVALRHAGRKREALLIADEIDVLMVGPRTNRDLIMECGQELLRIGRYQKAIAFYSEVIDRNSRNVGAITNRGICFFNLDRKDEAAAEFICALTIKSDHAPAIKYLAACREI